MTRHLPRSGRQGFTLIEILVALILLALLAAAVFPVVTQQVDKGDPTRTANDLANIRTGIETFQLNVRPSYPGDLEDLAFRINAAADRTLGDTTYTATQVSRWNGPYIDLSVLETGVTLPGTAATETGYGARVMSDLTCYTAVNNPAAPDDTGDTCAPATHFVAVQITGLTELQFEDLNDLIDGTTETDSNSHFLGKLRYDDLDSDGVMDTGENAYFLVTPFRGN